MTLTTLTLRDRLDPTTAADLERLMASAPNAHPSQHPGLPSSSPVERGEEVVHLVGRDSDGDLGLAALIRLRRVPLLGFTVADMFRGPTARSPEALLAGLAGLEPLLVGRASVGERLLSVRVDPYWRGDGSAEVARGLARLGYRPMAEPPYHQRTLVLSIDREDTKLLASFKGSARQQVRKAREMKLEVREDLDDDGLGRFIELYRRMSDTRGASPRSAEYLRATRDLFRQRPERGFLLSTWKEGALLAAICIFTHGRRAIYAHGATSREAPSVPKSHGLHYAAMQRARDRGCVEYDFGGFSDGVGTEGERTVTQQINRFKSAFGGTPVDILGGHERILRPLAYRFTRAAHRLARRLKEWRGGR